MSQTLRIVIDSQVGITFDHWAREALQAYSADEPSPVVAGRSDQLIKEIGIRSDAGPHLAQNIILTFGGRLAFDGALKAARNLSR